MKILLVISFILSSVTALACMPDGAKLQGNEEMLFGLALSRSNGVCYRKIMSQIGSLAANDVSVYEDADDMMVQYTVLGPSKRMKITRIKVKGKLTFSCGPVTGLTRGC